MAHSVSFLAVMLAFLAYESVLVDAAGQCPKSPIEAETAAKSCLKRIGLDIDASAGGGSMGNDINRVKQYCSDGTLQGALDCVDEILTACKKESRELAENLSKAISIDKLRIGFNYICDNLQVLEDNQQCIADNQGEIATCVQTETEKFQKELRVRQETGTMDQDDIWELSCGFMNDLFGCQHDVYSVQCSTELADVMTTFLQSAKPPICAQYGGSSAVTASWTLLSFLLALYLYLRD